MLNVGPNLVSSDGTSRQHKVGDTHNCGGATYMYILSLSAIAAGDAVIIYPDGSAESVDTTKANAEVVADCGIAQFAIGSAEYAWVPIGPFELDWAGNPFYVKAKTLCATDSKLYTTATAGEIDDTVTTLINGLRLTSTNAAGGTVLTPCTAVDRLGFGKS